MSKDEEESETYKKLKRWMDTYTIDASKLPPWPTGLSAEIAMNKFISTVKEEDSKSTNVNNDAPSGDTESSPDKPNK